jgi:hypothetical protein
MITEMLPELLVDSFCLVLQFRGLLRFLRPSSAAFQRSKLRAGALPTSFFVTLILVLTPHTPD